MLNLNLAQYGVILHINEKLDLDYSKPIVLDVETRGKEIGAQFVGIGVTQDGVNAYYYDSLEHVKTWDWDKMKIIGHNIKFDIHQLRSWGIKVSGKNLYCDTMIMSYVYDTTAVTHSLKPLSQKYLNIRWCSYSELSSMETEEFIARRDAAAKVLLTHAEKLTLPSIKKAIKAGCGLPLLDFWAEYKSKDCTLNFHDQETVAQYNGHDVIATWRLGRKFYSMMTVAQRRIFNTLELPTVQLLFDMECDGIQINLDELKRLHGVFGIKLAELESSINVLAGKEINANSPKQLALILEGLGLKIPLTKKKNKSVNKPFLSKHKHVPLVDAILRQREVKKLYSTYLDGFLTIPTLPRIHSTFNQVRYNDTEDEWEGMSTNRLSSNDPNMQNIPKRGTYAKLIRQLFIPKKDHVFIVGDYSQIEYRLLAHFSQDETLLTSFRDGKDLHQEVADALGCIRELAKQINYACIYGATAPKVAELAKISVLEAEVLLKKHELRFPKVYYWKNRELFKARRLRGIFTMLGRFIPLSNLASGNRWKRQQAERQAINYIIQGSAAEIVKMAMIDCAKAGFKSILQVHDELIFELKDGVALPLIKNIMENVMPISVPIDVDIRVGNSWAEAKA